MGSLIFLPSTVNNKKQVFETTTQCISVGLPPPHPGCWLVTNRIFVVIFLGGRDLQQNLQKSATRRASIRLEGGVDPICICTSVLIQHKFPTIPYFLSHQNMGDSNQKIVVNWVIFLQTVVKNLTYSNTLTAMIES